MKNNATELGVFDNLTKSEQVLLEALLNPENRMKSVADICKVAKVDRSTYYRAFQKPEFVEVYNKQSLDLVKQSTASVINTFVREAQRGSFQHGKVILEMAGLYAEKSDLKVSGQIETTQSELSELLEQRRKRVENNDS